MQSILVVIYNSLGKTKLMQFLEFHRDYIQKDSGSLRFDVNVVQDPLIHTVSYCNVIGNKCGISSSQVLFFCKYTTKVDYCTF